MIKKLKEFETELNNLNTLLDREQDIDLIDLQTKLNNLKSMICDMNDFSNEEF